jgi:hypothetical protein
VGSNARPAFGYYKGEKDKELQQMIVCCGEFPMLIGTEIQAPQLQDRGIST